MRLTLRRAIRPPLTGPAHHNCTELSRKCPLTLPERELIRRPSRCALKSEERVIELSREWLPEIDLSHLRISRGCNDFVARETRKKFARSANKINISRSDKSCIFIKRFHRILLLRTGRTKWVNLDNSIVVPKRRKNFYTPSWPTRVVPVVHENVENHYSRAFRRCDACCAKRSIYIAPVTRALMPNAKKQTVTAGSYTHREKTE